MVSTAVSKTVNVGSTPAASDMGVWYIGCAPAFEADKREFDSLNP